RNGIWAISAWRPIRSLRPWCGHCCKRRRSWRGDAMSMFLPPSDFEKLMAATPEANQAHAPHLGMWAPPPPPRVDYVWITEDPRLFDALCNALSKLRPDQFYEPQREIEFTC